MVTLEDLQVRQLGECRHESALAKYVGGRRTNDHYVEENDRVLFDDTISLLAAHQLPLDRVPTLEPGGPRRRVFFPPGATRAAIVTCGGLCPGLNDVIRGLVMELKTHYGVADVVGFRNGFAGLVAANGYPLEELTVERVSTILGTSRGAQDPELMVDRLVELGIDILFVIGGDGSIRGAGKLAAVARRRQLPIAVIGIPKTIDNDIPYIGQSFGFQTAFTVAAQSIAAAQVEAQSAINGVGLVQLMGRHAGFIACYAALANHHADFVLIPEVPFALEGESGFLAALERRVAERGSAVVVVAEGAGQDLIPAAQTGTDASGNKKLGDIGRFLEASIKEHYASINRELTLKFLKPSYSIRAVPAKAHDSVYCVRLAQAAAHAGMAGRTDMVVGRRHNRFVHVPIDVVVSERNEVAPDGDLWLSVLESTAQPLEMR
jgi:6-phosphofructokinase 1